MCPHRAVGNRQAAKFDAALSLLPHLPDPAGSNVNTKGPVTLCAHDAFHLNVWMGSVQVVNVNPGCEQ